MMIRIEARTQHCLPYFLSLYGLDVKSVKFKDYRDVDFGLKTCVLIGDGRRIKKVLRFISSFMSRSDFDWVIC